MSTTVKTGDPVYWNGKHTITEIDEERGTVKLASGATLDLMVVEQLIMSQPKEQSDGSTADYYVLPEGATQLQQLISHKNMNAQVGEIFRACYRYGEVAHSEMLRDAKKMLFYAQAEVERLEKLNGSS